jgi:hypothetical protein
VIGAFAFLILRSARNRFWMQVRRARNPQYAVALIIGVLYFVFIFWGRGHRPQGMQNPMLGAPVQAIAPLFILITMAGWWFFGGDRTALAFTEAEVAMLFTAPVSRRGLITYKIVRAQVTILISVMIWSLIMRRGGGPLPGLASSIAFWAVFSTLSLHKLGAALVRSSAIEHGRSGVRRNWFSMVIALLVVMYFMAQASGGAAAANGEGSPFSFLDSIVAYVSKPQVQMALYPWRLITAPIFAPTLGAWAMALGPALLIMMLHAVWVLRMNVAFEEAAAVASTERARMIEAMRSRRGIASPPKSTDAARTIALSAKGHPGVAIFWKNSLSLMRASRMTVLIGPIFMTGMLAVMMPRGRTDAAGIVALVSLLITAVLLLVGGRTVRNDLRSDMLHLGFLKSLPLSGADVVLAEVMSAAVPMFLIELSTTLVAFVALGLSSTPLVSDSLRLALMLGAPFVLFAMNAATFAILNGTAVLFPAWIRLGPTGAGGIEAMGQNILTTFGTWLVLLLLLVIPVLTVGVVFSMVSLRTTTIIVLGMATGSLMLAAEAYAVVRWLGHLFDKAEPAHVPQ